MIRILLVAAQRTMVSMLVEAASDAKLQPVGLDLIPFALVRAVGTDESAMGLEDSGGEAVVDVGAQVTTVAVHSRQVVQFVRVLPSGGHDITVAIGRALGTDNHVAERLKRGEEAGGINVEEARRVAQVALGTFVDEIRSSLDFFAQVQGSHVTRLLVTGGGSNLEGLLELMRERIPVNVERGQAFLHVRSELDLIPEALVEAETVLAAAVGLGIQGTAA